MSKPWLESGSLRDYPDQPRASDEPTAMVGLFTFLCVATSVFGLFIVSYNFRMVLPDWVSMSKPGLLWFNTLLLILGSVAFQAARNAGETDDVKQVKLGVIVGGVTSILFVVGAVFRLAPTDRGGRIFEPEPGQRILFPDHGATRPACAGRPVGLG